MRPYVQQSSTPLPARGFTLHKLPSYSIAHGRGGRGPGAGRDPSDHSTLSSSSSSAKTLSPLSLRFPLSLVRTHGLPAAVSAAARAAGPPSSFFPDGCALSGRFFLQRLGGMAASLPLSSLLFDGISQKPIITLTEPRRRRRRSAVRRANECLAAK